jgi:hypothetical protein
MHDDLFAYYQSLMNKDLNSQATVKTYYEWNDFLAPKQ